MRMSKHRFFRSSISIFQILRILYFFLLVSFLGCDAPDLDDSKGISADFDDSDPPPNVIFILADDLGYHDLGVYGQELIKTPNIDQLAAEGIRFTNFYAGSPVCAPSRSVLLTGQHTGHTRVRANYARQGGLGKPPRSDRAPGHLRVGLQESDTTIGNIMQHAGYWTGLMGKWHLSGYDKANLPLHRGFNEYRGSNLAGRGSGEPKDNEAEDIPQKFSSDYNDDIKTYHAIDFIQRNRDKHFFLMVTLSAPHKPFEIFSQGIYKDRSWNEMSKNYAAMVTRMDWHVGEIMEALKREGVDKNTILLFGSDNGGEYRNYGGSNPVFSQEDWAQWTQLFKSNHPLKGGKADMYEGGIRVPMILRWPGQIKGGSVNNDLWYFPDFMPTLAAIGGVKPPADIDGINMLPILKKEEAYPKDRHLYWEFYHQSFAQAIRWQNWKLIRWSTYRKRIYGQKEINDQRRSEKFSFLELYNLGNDIAEEHNIVEQYPEIRQMLLDRMDSTRTESPYWPLTPEEKENLNYYSIEVN